ncbi:MAG: hypothetical protein ACOCV2_06750, partial [Persicimonas sp.]
VLAQVEVEPSHDADDQFEGFRIVDFDPRAKEAVGDQIRKGDVVTHVNGERLEKPDDYHEAWSRLDGAHRIHIDLLRDGEPDEAVWRVE